MDKKRYYNFMIVCYEEQFLDVIKKIDIFEYIGICHDKDIDEFGENLKKHWHILCKVENAKTLTSLSKFLELDINLIEPIKTNFNNSLKYLLHIDKNDKYQYSIDNVFYNHKPFFDKLCNLLNPHNEEYSIQILLDFINNCEHYIYLNSFIQFVLNNNLYSYFRRSSIIFIKLIDEHNKMFDKY